MLEIFLVLIARIFEAYEAKFPNDPNPYKKAIEDGSISDFETLGENGKSKVLQILEIILAGRFSDILKLFEDGLAFKVGKKGGQLKSLFNLALRSCDNKGIVLLFKPTSIKVTIVYLDDTCPGDGYHRCCCDCDGCGLIRGKTSIMSVEKALWLPDNPYVAGARVLGCKIRELTQLEENLLILILVSNIEDGSPFDNILEDKPLITGMGYGFNVDGKWVMIPHHACNPKKSRITSITTMDLNSVDSFAGALHYRFWSDPQIDASEGRVLSRSHRQMVWTVMHVALRLETTSTSPTLADVLSYETWLLIMTFVKHV
jgi:hypothetical protein